MKTYLLIFLLAAGSSLVLTPLIRRLCERMGWLDEVRDARRVHKKPIPRLGGVALFGALIISLGVLPLIENQLTLTLRTSLPRLWPIVLPAALIFLCGVYDDLFGVNARFKFTAQILAGVLFYALGGRIEGLAMPVLHTVMLPSSVGFIVTVFWVVAITNAFNLLDGLDGLAAGAALFASLVLLIVSYQMEQPLITIFALALCGALAGFLRYNFNPASIFLGDSGSLLLGFLLSALAVQGAQKASTAVALTIPLIAFGLPIFDTLVSLARRFISGKPLFAGDREHVHHKLLERGWSQRKVVLSLYGVCALLGLFSLLFINNSSITGLFLVVVAVVVILGLSGLRYHEVAEVQAGVRRNSLERRDRVANNVCVRRAAQQMSQANSLPEIVAALETMLEQGQWAGAQAWFSAPTARASVAADWVWTRDGELQELVFSAPASWSVALPLVAKGQEWGRLEVCRLAREGNLLLDINLLSRLFTREMTRALARLEAAPEPVLAPPPARANARAASYESNA